MNSSVNIRVLGFKSISDARICFRKCPNRINSTKYKLWKCLNYFRSYYLFALVTTGPKRVLDHSEGS